MFSTDNCQPITHRKQWVIPERFPLPHTRETADSPKITENISLPTMIARSVFHEAYCGLQKTCRKVRSMEHKNLLPCWNISFVPILTSERRSRTAVWAADRPGLPVFTRKETSLESKRIQKYSIVQGTESNRNPYIQASRMLRHNVNRTNERSYGWVHWLQQETGVPEAICIIALNHARGNVLVARDFLESETARTRFIREAAEYGLLN